MRFSDYANFQPRTLDEFEKIFQSIPKLRPNKICRLVVSADPRAKKIVQGLINNDPQLPAFIVFDYDELNHSFKTDFFHSRIRQHFFSRDLFDVDTPIQRDTNLFGRTEIVRRITDRIKSSENFSLFGLRKSGKTSIINAVNRTLPSNTVLLIDCQSPAVHARRWNQLLLDLCVGVHKYRGAGLPAPREEEFSSDRASSSFTNFFDRWRAKNENNRVAIVFDEIERISFSTGASQHWRHENDFVFFWQTLRSCFQSGSGALSFGLIGTSPETIETARIFQHDNPIFGFVSIEYVKGLDQTQVHEMLNILGGPMGMSFDPGAASLLSDQLGGHPYLVRKFASALNKSIHQSKRPCVVDKGAIKKQMEKFHVGAESYVRMMLDVFSECYSTEFGLARMLASNPDEWSSIYADDKAALSHLEGFGIVQMQSSGPVFQMEIVSRYLTERYRYDRENLDQSERRAEISERRNALELNLRKFIRFSLILNFGKLAVDKILMSVDEERRLELAQLPLDQLLGSTTPLYFRDLTGAIMKNWSVFQNFFDSMKDEVRGHLDCINTYRADAHALDISDRDFAKVRKAFEFFEEALERVPR